MTGEEVKRRILIADDDPDILELLQTLLASRCERIDVARDGEEALSLLQESRARPYDLFISDVMMPNCTGVEVIRAMQGMGMETAVIVISGADESAYVDDLDVLGISHRLSKPFEFADLLGLIDQAMPREPVASQA